MTGTRTARPHACAPRLPSGREHARATPLIHNMSCRPTVSIVHSSAALCRRVRFTSPKWPIEPEAFADFCPAFGLPTPSVADGYARLVEAADAPCPLLARLPPVAAVLRNAAGDAIPGLTDDPTLLLAVMTRCFGSVFLRDLPPSVTSDSFRNPVTLLIPDSWNLNP
jgi:hypothetical protein